MPRPAVRNQYWHHCDNAARPSVNGVRPLPSRRLQLMNPSKTYIVWFGTKANLKKMENSDLSLHVGNDVIEPVSVVRDLSVLLSAGQ